MNFTSNTSQIFHFHFANAARDFASFLAGFDASRHLAMVVRLYNIVVCHGREEKSDGRVSAVETLSNALYKNNRMACPMAWLSPGG